jgi:hypothetical protein
MSRSAAHNPNLAETRKIALRYINELDVKDSGGGSRATPGGRACGGLKCQKEVLQIVQRCGRTSMELDTVVSGSAGKRRRDDVNRNGRNCKRSAVMRVCTAGEEGSGSDLGAGGSGNEAGGGEMEYDGRVPGIGVSAGKEGDMGGSGQWAHRGWWETGGLD